MKRKFSIIMALVAISPLLFSFCGIYVSKSDGTLKNKTSQVIMVRDGNRNVITMYNDFRGNSRDFAMVVPVPVVLKKADIKVVSQDIFQKLNDYSAPRLVEYYDQNPCSMYVHDMKEESMSANTLDVVVTAAPRLKKSSVKIEAQYLVGEYDIMILSANESAGLKTWLIENGYKIPASAEEVLEPYIKSNLKFFVAKVNKDFHHKGMAGQSYLRPLQISFSSPKFMLPIRLGMANGDGDQDLIVYSFTRSGRVECVNYRNVEMPTGNKIPLFVKDDFNKFYSGTFDNTWRKEGKNIGLLEYAWDVSPVNYMKCDPCVGNPPVPQDLVQAGVWWVGNPQYDDGSANQKVFFTRMHFRYNRNKFAQDLAFQVTPNTENFQARYVVTHPATGDLSCEQGQRYLQGLKNRRKGELRELVALTGSTLSDYLSSNTLNSEDESSVSIPAYAALAPVVGREMEEKPNGSSAILVFSVAMIGATALLRWKGLV